jgi:hypothetical protein
MAIKVKNPNGLPVLQWYAKSTNILANQLIKSDTGASPVAATHTGQTILGITLEDQDTANGIVYFYPITGQVLEIDFDPDATKTSFAVTDLGSLYDMVVTDGDQVLDPDDTTGGFLFLVGYNNDAHKAYVVVDAADILLSA